MKEDTGGGLVAWGDGVSAFEPQMISTLCVVLSFSTPSVSPTSSACPPLLAAPSSALRGHLHSLSLYLQSTREKDKEKKKLKNIIIKKHS